MRSCNCYALGAVDGAAAAHSDQAIALLGLVDFRRGAHSGFRGVGRRLVKHRMGQAAKSIDRLLQDSRRFDAWVSHDQRLADAGALTFLAQQFDGAEVELNLRDVVDKSHDLQVPEGRSNLPNLRPARGPANKANPE